MAFIRALQTMSYDYYTDLPVSAQNGDLAWCTDTNLTYRYQTANTTWAPLVRDVVKQSTVTVTGTSTGTTAVYTLEGSGTLNFYPTQVVFQAVSITGATLKPTFTLGSNSTAYDNIASASLIGNIIGLTGVATQGSTVSLSPGLPGGTVINVKISTGALATSYTFRMAILGFYGL